jgi:DNA-binding NtrC family response regulator
MELVTKGGFREDLFYRLYVVPLDVPPLRERPDDLVLLLKHFSREISLLYKRPAPRYSVSARNLLKAYDWPGNLRELHNLCERMVILMAGRIVQPENLPLEIRCGKSSRQTGSLFALPAGGVDLLAMEGEMIRQALGMAGGNRSKAARLLRLTRDTLLYRIQKHNIQI